MALQIQASIANSIGVFTNGSGVTRMVYPDGFTPQMGKRVTFGVKCMADNGSQGEPKLDVEATSPNPTTISSSVSPKSKPTPKVSFFV